MRSHFLRSIHVLLSLLLLYLAGGCSSKEDASQAGTETAASDSVNHHTDATPGSDTPVMGESPEEDSCNDCAPGLTCSLTGECVQCANDDQCSYPEWCADGSCVASLCFPGLVGCEDTLPVVCGPDGDDWLSLDPCEVGHTCISGECIEQICVPGEKGCDQLQILLCNNNGTAWVHIPCAAGQACYADACETIKNNVLLIFDTSGSMGPVGGAGGIACSCGPGQCAEKPYPACEDSKCPLSRLGMTKKVLKTLFLSDSLGSVNFAMTRFPQVIRGTEEPVCEEMGDPFSFDPDFTVGHYASPASTMTGDDNTHRTSPLSYFEEYLHEVLCVPFPSTHGEDTVGLAQAWVDFDEEFYQTGNSCITTADCGADICVLNSDTAQSECGAHLNPELRATGSSPLGRSLFYAGEYLRKSMILDGKPCTAHGDCGNMNYLCSTENTCFDPLRECRSNTIVLFTDGLEQPETTTEDFFNPLVQAKRLRYGLGCAVDSDCLGSATCGDGDVCQGYVGANGSLMDDIAYIDAQGANTLTGHSGASIQVTIHVVDMSEGEGEAANRAIAEHGGGLYYPVSDGDPNLLFDAFSSALDIKSNLDDCVPNFPVIP